MAMPCRGFGEATLPVIGIRRWGCSFGFVAAIAALFQANTFAEMIVLFGSYATRR
jgi:hypothetical protein